MIGLLLACNQQEPEIRDIQCSPSDCLDVWLFSDDSDYFRIAINHIDSNWQQLEVTQAQRARLVKLATPPAKWSDVRNIIGISYPVDVQLLDQVIRTGLDPERADLATFCAGTNPMPDETNNPYCYGISSAVVACRSSKDSVCDVYRNMNLDWYSFNIPQEEEPSTPLRRVDR